MVQAVQRVLDTVLVFLIDNVAVYEQSQGGTVEGILKLEVCFFHIFVLQRDILEFWKAQQCSSERAVTAVQAVINSALP